MQSGAITVTANTQLANNTILSDTCTVNSLAIDNTNGYSERENDRLAYDLTDLSPTPIGSVLGPEIDTQIIYNPSGLVENVSYSSGSDSSWSLEEVLENGALAYSDTDITFSSVPYKYLNAEYLKLPSADNGALAADLINFSASKNIDVLVFRDIAVENPSWLNGYTLTKDIVTTSNGKIYRIYKKSVLAGTGITIGGNGDTTEIGLTGAMNIIAFKETTKIEDEIFFYENFQNSNGVPSILGWTQQLKTNTWITPEMNGTESTIHFIDSNTDAMAQIYKRFASQTGKLKFAYKIYVDNTLSETQIPNRFIRTFLHSGPVNEDPKKRDNLVTEIFLHAPTVNTTSFYNLIYRTKTGNTTDYPIKSNISIDAWHEYEYVVDIPAGTFTAKVDNVPITQTFNTYDSGNTFANYAIIGSGSSSLNNIYLAYVLVEPIQSTAIIGISVNGNAIEEFNTLTKEYLVKTAQGSIPNIVLNTRDANVTSSITYNEDYSEAEILVTDSTDNSVLLYKIYIDNEYVNKTELRSLVSYTNNLDEDCYTVSTWGNLQTILDSVQEKLISPDVTTLNLEIVISLLKQKITALKVDKNAIQQKYYP